MNGNGNKTAAIMIGIQGSGKSEYIRQKLVDRYVVISLDILNTRNKEKQLIRQCIENGQSFVIDNTNPTREDRIRYISAAKEAGYQVIGIFMQSVLQDCIRRNNSRTGKQKIPPKAIAATSNKLELPSYEEGFNELYFVSITEDGFKTEKWVTDHDF